MGKERAWFLERNKNSSNNKQRTNIPGFRFQRCSELNQRCSELNQRCQRFPGNEQCWIRTEMFLNQSWSTLNVCETSTRVIKHWIPITALLHSTYEFKIFEIFNCMYKFRTNIFSRVFKPSNSSVKKTNFQRIHFGSQKILKKVFLSRGFLIEVFKEKKGSRAVWEALLRLSPLI